MQLAKSLLRVIIFFLFAVCGFLSITLAADPDDRYSEVWKIRSLKKIGGHPVKVFGNPEIVKTKQGKAIKFDGIDDRLLVENNPISNSKEFTVEVIFKPERAFDISNAPRFIHIQDPDDPLNKRVLIELRLTQNNEWYLDGFLLTDAGERTLVNRSLLHPAGDWFHAAITYKNNTFKTFVNGVQEVTGNISFSEKLINESGKTSIGGRMDHRNYFCGLIKTLKITRKALDPEQFIQINK